MSLYATRAVSKDELANLRKVFAGLMGHLVTGYDAKFNPIVETDSEIRAVQVPEVIFIRRRMPNGRNIYRRIEERP